MSARSLLIAAAVAALIATALLAGLAEYNRAVAVAGGRSAVAAAPANERSMLVRGPTASADTWTERDAALRGLLADGLAGAPVTIPGSGSSSGRQFTGDTGNAVPDSSGLIFANVMFLDGITERADLVNGAWPVPGAKPAQTVVGEAAATVLNLTVGDRIPITDRYTGDTDELVVSGVFKARDPVDPYWLLAPGVSDRLTPGGATYGPLVLDRSDFFDDGWSSNGNGAWLIEPDLSGLGITELIRVRSEVRKLSAQLLDEVGFGDTGQTNTGLGGLVQRLERADLVGRSALLTPMLLIAVLAGYALLLLASLLTEQRRAETALLRARGAGRFQLASLATREAFMVALPAAVIAPPLVARLLRETDNVDVLGAAGLRLEETLTPLTWAVAGVATAGCMVAMLLPALRGGATYVADLAEQSRPTRVALAQRAGLDIVLVVFAGLAWFQLQQYESPLAGAGGQLGIDPLLAAAAPIGVLAGSVLALRLLPPLTRYAERLIDREPWFATQLGMWQAGRRPHAGPVLLLALTVAISTLAWTLAASAERSNVDQADHLSGMDLRLTEASGFAPLGRGAQIADLSGVISALPGYRQAMQLGEKFTPAELIGFDAAAVGDGYLLRDDFGNAEALLGKLAEQRTSEQLSAPAGQAPGPDDSPTVALPAGATTLRGTLTIAGEREFWMDVRATTDLVLMDAHGGIYRVPLVALSQYGVAREFTVSLPRTTSPLAIVGFVGDGHFTFESMVTWSVSDLVAVNAGGAETPVDLKGAWDAVDAAGNVTPANAAAGEISFSNKVPARAGIGISRAPTYRFALVRPLEELPVPAVATPAALAALHTSSGEVIKLQVGGHLVAMRIVAAVGTLPGTTQEAAILVDLPSLARYKLQVFRTVLNVQEWWIDTEPQRHAEAAAAADRIPGIDVYDRVSLAEESAGEPYGVGARLALFIAALGAIALALVSVAVDVRATARRRVGELAVLHTLGATPRLLARALIIEQAFLAGLGVLVGLLVGIGVAATMVPLVILTPTGDRPIPIPSLELGWQPFGTALLLMALAMLMAGLMALTMRQRLAAAQLRIGAER